MVESASIIHQTSSAGIAPRATAHLLRASRHRASAAYREWFINRHSRKAYGILALFSSVALATFSDLDGGGGPAAFIHTHSSILRFRCSVYHGALPSFFELDSSQNQ